MSTAQVIILVVVAIYIIGNFVATTIPRQPPESISGNG